MSEHDPNQLHQHSDDGFPSNSAHSFKFKHNLVLFFKTFVRCLATTVFIAFVLATLKIYQKKGNFTSHQKTNFNIIITALSLCLGLNFFVSHKFCAQRRRLETFFWHSEISGLVQRLSKSLAMEDLETIPAPCSNRPRSKRLDISHRKLGESGLAWMEISLDPRIVRFLHYLGKPPLWIGSCLESGNANLG